MCLAAFSHRCWGLAGCMVARNLQQALQDYFRAVLGSVGSALGPESSELMTGCHGWTYQVLHGSAP